MRPPFHLVSCQALSFQIGLFWQIRLSLKKIPTSKEDAPFNQGFYNVKIRFSLPLYVSEADM